MEKENNSFDEVYEMLKKSTNETEEQETTEDTGHVYNIHVEYMSDDERERSAKKIKLSDLKISSVKTEDEKTQNILDLISSKPRAAFIATQSGYSGTIEPLTMRDFVTIYNSNLDSVEGKKMLISTIYKKIKETNCTPGKKMNFEMWKEKTSIGDLQSFYYALYCATFPDQGSFVYECPKCGEVVKSKILNDSLITSSDNDYIKQVRELIKTKCNSIETMDEYSLMNPKNNDLFECPSGDVVFELTTPSIKTFLGIHEIIDAKTLSTIGVDLLNEILHINRMFLKNKDGEFVEYQDKTSILALLSSISNDDQFVIREEVYKRMEEQYVYYSIKNPKCTNCNHKMNEIRLNMENLLFTLIFEKAS